MGEFQRPIQSSKVTYKPVLNIFQFSQKKKKTKKQNQDYFCNKHTTTTVFIDLKHAILKVRRQTKMVD